MSTTKDRLTQMEQKLEWITNWINFFIKEYYQVDALDKVTPTQQIEAALMKREQPNEWVA